MQPHTSVPTIVGGVDGSSASLAGARLTGRLAKPLGARLILAHASQVSPEDDIEVSLEGGRRLLEQVSVPTEVEVVRHAVLGDPAERLAEKGEGRGI